MKFERSRRRHLTRIVLPVLLVSAVFMFLWVKKDSVARELVRFVESTLSRETDLEIHLGKVSGHVLGWASFKDVRIEAPWLPESQRIIFKAREIQFRYRFLDFISKKFDSKVTVVIDRPEVHWSPNIRIKKSNFPFMRWMRQWALSQKNHLVIEVKNLSITSSYENKGVQGVQFRYENNSIQMDLPISHAPIMGSDVSSVIRIEGAYQEGIGAAKDSISGRIRTEGTVINWTPLPEEAEFHFDFSEEALRVVSTSFLGGVEFTGEIDFARDYQLDFMMRASNYPIKNLAPFFKMDEAFHQNGRVDAEIHFFGDPWSPQVDARTRLYEGWLGSKDFKAMDVNVSGVIPTLRLSDSRILLEDGSIMRFAETDLEMRELFRTKTYDRLVSESQQDSVVWGTWEFSRPKDTRDQYGFLVEKNFSERASVSFRQENKESDYLEDDDITRGMEVSFDYRLRSKDTLKVQFKDDEEFVGVEHKMRF